MIGCNKKTKHKRKKSSRKRKTKYYTKNKKGGSDLSLAYTGTKPNLIPNPFLGLTKSNMTGGSSKDFLSYTGKGGSCNMGTCNGGTMLGGGGGYPKPPMNADNIMLSKSGSVFPGSAPYLVTGGAAVDTSKAYPSTVGTPAIQNWLNSQIKKGGTKGGGCGCQTMGSLFSMKGGRNYGDLVPNGHLGEPWTGSIKTWPGVDGVSMNRNHFPLNTYANDVSRQMLNVGANFPFNIKGGKKRHHSKKHKKRHYKQKGRGMSNYLGTDILNLGRTLNYNIQSNINEASAVKPPVSPLPWRGQFA